MGGAAAIVAGVGIIWGKGIVPTARWVKRFAKAVGQFADSVDTLFGIADEFKPNDGHSLHDRLKRIEDVQQATAAEIADISRKVTTITTEELPIITALAEQIIAEQSQVATDLTDAQDAQGPPDPP